jgi:ankyrin repeat protein
LTQMFKFLVSILPYVFIS